MSERSHVALTRCFFCGEPDKILLCTRYTPSGQPVKDMSEFNGQCIDREPCPKCKAYMQQGIIVITVRDGEHGDNPYRTGGFCVLREDAIRRIISNNQPLLDSILRKRVLFMEDSVANAIGLPRGQQE